MVPYQLEASYNPMTNDANVATVIENPVRGLAARVATSEK